MHRGNRLRTGLDRRGGARELISRLGKTPYADYLRRLGDGSLEPVRAPGSERDGIRVALPLAVP